MTVKKKKTATPSTSKKRGLTRSEFYEACNATRKKTGYRSLTEANLAKYLKSAGVPFEYETKHYTYEVPAKTGTYTPDFILNNKIHIECKGFHFDAQDRQKLIMVKKQLPDLDIRLVFDNGDTKASGLTISLSRWAQKNGFPWANGPKVPDDWIREAFDDTSDIDLSPPTLGEDSGNSQPSA